MHQGGNHVRHGNLSHDDDDRESASARRVAGCPRYARGLRAELTWAPVDILESLGIAPQKHLGFRTADGRTLYRDIGYAIVHVGKETIDEVVFGAPGDMVLLGARSLEGLTLRVDARAKKLVDGGPILAVAAS